MRHARWERAGRTFDLPNGDRVYKGEVGQQNLALEDGTFAPFTWDGAVLRYAGVEARFAAGRVEFWRDGWRESAVRPRLQRFGADGWSDVECAARIERLPDEDDFGPVAFARIAIVLEGSCATGHHIIVAGGRRRARADSVVVAHRPGTYRMVLEHVLGGARHKAYHLRSGALSGEGFVSHRGWRVAWAGSEAALRLVERTRGGIRISLPSVTRAPAVRRTPSVVVSPDTYGPASDAGGADDVSADASGYLVNGDAQTTGGHTGGHLYLDESTAGEGSISFRFASINLGGNPASINAGTQISLQRENDNSNANGNVRFKAQNSNAPLTAATGDRPYARTQASASHVHSFPLDGSTQTPDLSGVIDGLRGLGFSYSGGAGDAMMITGAATLFGDASVSWRYVGPDKTHPTFSPAALTIVFTPATAQVGGDGTGTSSWVPTFPHAADYSTRYVGGTGDALNTDAAVTPLTVSVEAEINRFGGDRGLLLDPLPIELSYGPGLLQEMNDLCEIWRDSLSGRTSKPRSKSKAGTAPLGGSVGASPPGAPFDPTQQSMTAIFRDFTTGPWNGTASLGTSSSHIFSNGSGGTVVAGSSLNGHGTAAMVQASSDYFTLNVTGLDLLGQGGSITGWSGYVLVNVSSIATNTSPFYQNDGIMCTSGSSSFGIYLKSTGIVGMGIFNGTINPTVETSFTTGIWQLVQFKWDGTSMFIRVNGASWSAPVATTAPTGSGLTFELGRSPGVEYMNGTIAEFGMTNVTWSDGFFEGLRQYASDRYQLSL